MSAATAPPVRHTGAHRRRRLGRLRGALQAFGFNQAPALLCGSPEPPGQIEPAWRMPYRCTGTEGHYGAHWALIDGVIEAVWWA
jgi:hypothetical protein